QIEDGASPVHVLDTKYMRYYRGGEAGGYAKALKFVFGPQSYARLSAAFPDPTSASDAQVAPYADLYLQYDSNQRVIEAVVQGAGCSGCGTGLGTFTYSYSQSKFGAGGYNDWARKTTETLPDGSVHTVYMNYAGEVILDVLQDVASGR